MAGRLRRYLVAQARPACTHAIILVPHTGATLVKARQCLRVLGKRMPAGLGELHEPAYTRPLELLDPLVGRGAWAIVIRAELGRERDPFLVEHFMKRSPTSGLKVAIGLGRSFGMAPPQDQDRLLRAMGEARRELCDAAIKMQSRSLTKAGAETSSATLTKWLSCSPATESSIRGSRTARLGRRPQRRRRTTPSSPPPSAVLGGSGVFWI
jgi:hypothetical protein